MSICLAAGFARNQPIHWFDCILADPATCFLTPLKLSITPFRCAAMAQPVARLQASACPLHPKGGTPTDISNRPRHTSSRSASTTCWGRHDARPCHSILFPSSIINRQSSIDNHQSVIRASATKLEVVYLPFYQPSLAPLRTPPLRTPPD